MKKSLLLSVLILCLAVASWAQMPPQKKMTAEEVQKALDMVQKPVPAPDKYKVGLDSITENDMMAVLTFLASDWMEGRETGTPGYDMAADYAASMFKLWGIKPGGVIETPSFGRFGMMSGREGNKPPAMPARTYFQPITFRETSDARSSMTVEVRKGETSTKKTFEAGVDYMNMNSQASSLTGPVVFVGYGIKEPSIGWDDLKGLNLKDKIVVVLSGAPGRDDPKSPFQKKELKEKYFPAGPQFMGPMPAYMRGMMGPRFSKFDEITKLGPAAILIVPSEGKDADVYNALSAVRKPDDSRPIVNKPRRRLSIPGAGPEMPFEAGAPSISITREMADSMLEAAGQSVDGVIKKIRGAYKPAPFDLPGVKVSIESTAVVKLTRSMNIIGWIEGSDPVLKNEFFVVGGHFDHMGKWGDYIYNGSDDNASGSVGVMFIARAMALNPVKPKRSIVFCLWAGEEEGLLGSRYYVGNPLFPIDKTVGYLNYDMISRAFDDETILRQTRQFVVPGVEETVKKIRAPQFSTVSMTKDSGFYEITKEMNKYVGLDLFMRQSEPGQGGGGSDHSSFISVKVPFVYYMTSMHPDYHQTGDSPDKASGDLLAKITKMGYLTVFAYADK